jgi:hypothetical protein
LHSHLINLDHCTVTHVLRYYNLILKFYIIIKLIKKLVYMHAWYIACAQAKKLFFFVKLIELIRSIQNSFEFFKSNENWAQLQALKLRSFDVLIFWCSWCSSLTYLFFFYVFRKQKKNKYASEEHQEHQKIKTSKDLNFKACNWAQFLSDLQNSNEFWMLRISSINFTKKKIFFACAHAVYDACM